MHRIRNYAKRTPGPTNVGSHEALSDLLLTPEGENMDRSHQAFHFSAPKLKYNITG